MTSEPRPWLRGNPANPLVRALREARAAPPPAGAAQRVRARLDRQLAAAKPPPPWRLTAVKLVSAGAVAAGLAVGVAAWPVRQRLAALPAAGPTPAPPAAAPALVPVPAAAAPSVALARPASPARPAPRSRAGAASITALADGAAPAPIRARVRAPAPTAGADPETAVLRAAVDALRLAKAPERALELLNGYEARFPNGKLASDARLLRVEVLLALHREAQALELLSPEALLEAPRADALQLLRGELLAQLGRTTEASACFQAVLATAAPQLRERAAADLAALTGATRNGD